MLQRRRVTAMVSTGGVAGQTGIKAFSYGCYTERRRRGSNAAGALSGTQTQQRAYVLLDGITTRKAQP
jgi:hypothetical protein